MPASGSRRLAQFINPDAQPPADSGWRYEGKRRDAKGAVRDVYRDPEGAKLDYREGDGPEPAPLFPRKLKQART